MTAEVVKRSANATCCQIDKPNHSKRLVSYPSVCTHSPPPVCSAVVGCESRRMGTRPKKSTADGHGFHHQNKRFRIQTWNYTSI